jgi:hypothetical protein
MAQPLLLQRKTVGVSKTPATFSASWKSPSLVAPSPNWTIATASSPRWSAAHPTPTAWRVWVAIGTATGKTLASWRLARSSPIQ